jgi:two-component system chemotaxis response regulator CheB
VPSRRLSPLRGKVKLLAIGASTGGPVAVAEVINGLPAGFPAPVLITQHMPAKFTQAFAERLNRTSALSVKEAENGDRLERGWVYVAPGGKQMMVERGKALRIIDGDERLTYRPSVDLTFASAANHYGASVLAIVLTGMGADGCDGARILKEKGATVWSQDEQSCVVYGMPAAVERENISACVLPLSEIAPKLAAEL